MSRIKDQLQVIMNGRSYDIVPVRNGSGYNVVVRGIINPMPGGTGGFQTIEQAVLSIRILERAGDDSDRFWNLWYRVSGVTQKSRDQNKAFAALIGMKVERISRHEHRLVQIDKVSA
ncbi:hypothetical protein AUK40_00680 [Candidatus Wirthbacteria bacterium CG2_30_54_11]|uniref:Uncharacterized protein n=1 Tax=Candidatus Wirthbacteria bacterium CG2_30_54_11 TaxID=1817892 RepID=A0A1J5IYH1_9BACT|nr:MAG: hypothetical protein AUK40_00680 [Candidatus Wirthbacteria bacterium CG2_30_54_11]